MFGFYGTKPSQLDGVCYAVPQCLFVYAGGNEAAGLDAGPPTQPIAHYEISCDNFCDD